MSIFITWVEGETHDAEVLVADAFQGVKLLYLVERGIEKVPLCLGGTHHESRIGHVGINGLDNQIFGTLALILVGALAHQFILPLLFTLQVFHITLTDILHNHRNRHLHAALTCARTS